jgi:ribosomal protein S18 acetylase RimI-like enzyme
VSEGRKANTSPKNSVSTLADKQFFKRYRMEIRLDETSIPEAVLPDGYFFQEWCESDLERHALTKFRSFRDEVDSEVFSCLGEYYGCLRLMSDIANQENFLRPATWLVGCAEQAGIPQDCGTIQGIGLTEQLGSIQNIGVVPEHRGLGLGRALLLRSLAGFQSADIKRVVLEVTAGNQTAVDLYRDVGFRVIRTMYRVAPVDETLS